MRRSLAPSVRKKKLLEIGGIQSKESRNTKTSFGSHFISGKDLPSSELFSRRTKEQGTSASVSTNSIKISESSSLGNVYNLPHISENDFFNEETDTCNAIRDEAAVLRLLESVDETNEEDVAYHQTSISDDKDELNRRPVMGIFDSIIDDNIGWIRPCLTSQIKTSFDKTTSLPTYKDHVNITLPPETSMVTLNRQYFNVVWGRRTTRKHKTFENDGVLEVINQTATLKDIDGKFVGSISVKYNELDESSCLTMGSNECEIIERIDESSVKSIYKRTRYDGNSIGMFEDEPLVKKSNRCSNPSFFMPFLSLSNSKLGLKGHKFSLTFERPKQPDYEPLIMPDPCSEYCMKYNYSNRPVQQVSVVGCLVKHLRPHQRDGILFLYECLMGYRNFNDTKSIDTDNEYMGCILADEMGLGKTLQCIAVCYTLLKQGPYGLNVANKILIVTPSSLVDNWSNEIRKWLNNERVYTYQLDGKHNIQQYVASAQIPFLLISYEMLTRNFDDLRHIHFDVIICDEGHRLKNNTIKAAQNLSQLDCRRRVILTGTPIQNDLQEFYSLIDFVNPGLLGNYIEYKRQFETPIVQSRQASATDDVQKLGEERARELNQLTMPYFLRRTQDAITEYLPDKQVIILFCRPSVLQQTMLRSCLEFYMNKIENVDLNPLQVIIALRKICNHPSLIQPLDAAKHVSALTEHLTATLPSWNKMAPFDSGKLSILIDLLQQLSDKDEKIVIISYHTQTLDMLESIAEHLEYTYCRLDGSTQTSLRNAIVERFNDPDDNTRVFLLSAKAGGVGLNLVGASRLILFDNDWNPASDAQAMSRIWRDGQKRNVYIYRLITVGTIEEKIFQRQLSKTVLGDCIIDSLDGGENQSLKFSDEDLKDLFSVQREYEICHTHDSILECNCIGDGTIPHRTEDKENIEPGAINVGQKSLKMYELMSWEHHKFPKNDILYEVGLVNSVGNVLFMFRNRNK